MIIQVGMEHCLKILYNLYINCTYVIATDVFKSLNIPNHSFTLKRLMLKTNLIWIELTNQEVYAN